MEKYRKRDKRILSPSTILPTTYQSNDTQTFLLSPLKSCNHCINSPPNIKRRTHATTCNSFLLGGTYYPGKDKRRRDLRKRTLWYRIFCSSFRRQLASMFLCLYLGFVFGFQPFYNAMFYYGVRLSTDGRNSNTPPGEHSSFSLLKTKKLKKDMLRPMTMKKEEAEALHKYFMDRRWFSDEKRLKALENIIPDFYHRNDRSISPKVAKKRDQNKEEQLDNQRIANTNEKGDTHEREINNVKASSSIPPPKDEDKTLSAPRLRTLQNISQQTVRSKCPTNLSTQSITLVIQTTADRLPFILEICKRWTTNPLIVVVYILSNTSKDEITMHEIRNTCSNTTLLLHKGKSEDELKSKYPINMLRNMGLDEVRTSHVMVMDVDFIPSQGLDGAIENALFQQQKVNVLRRDNINDETLKMSITNDNFHKKAIVIPAFERKVKEPCLTIEDCENSEKDADFFPKSMETLRNCHKQKKCGVFQEGNNVEGHHSTASLEWLQHDSTNSGKTDDTMRVIPCFDSYRYEPYVVIPWCLLESGANHSLPLHPLSPYYDERFYGYGKNKIQQIAHLRVSGYSFSVLPNGFITHHPHPESPVKTKWNRNELDLHKTMDNLYPIYLKELHKRYHDVNIATPICKRG